MPRKKTTEQFVESARSIHGLQYDYSDVEYVSSKTPVTIRCQKHGKFRQSPGNHLQGRGCPKCDRIRRTMTKPQFIEKAQSIHGSLYDYVDVEYINSQTKVLIHCPTHNGFWQLPLNHLKGHGCAKCGYKVSADAGRFTQEQFIEKARSVHGLRYNYDKVKYVDSQRKVVVSCLEHGDFEVTPANHLKNRGCYKCGIISLKNKQRSTTAQFVKKAQSIHGDFYKYNDVQYVNNSTKVLIHCPDHGGWWVTPANHLKKRGCPKCGRKTLAKKRSLSQDTFIERAKAIHGDKYDYSGTTYVGIHEKVNICCPLHGDFSQVAATHLDGSGCTSCALYGFDCKKPAILYFLEFEKPFAKFWKIGITNRTLKERFGLEDFFYIKEQTVWEFASGDDAHQIETLALQEFAKYKFNGSRFDLLKSRGDTECLVGQLPAKEVIHFINNQIEKLDNNCNVSPKDTPNQVQLTLPLQKSSHPSRAVDIL